MADTDRTQPTESVSDAADQIAAERAHEVTIWGLSEDQARVLWQLAHDWDLHYVGPRWDGVPRAATPPSLAEVEIADIAAHNGISVDRLRRILADLKLPVRAAYVAQVGERTLLDAADWLDIIRLLRERALGEPDLWHAPIEGPDGALIAAALDSLARDERQDDSTQPPDDGDGDGDGDDEELTVGDRLGWDGVAP